MTRGSEEVRVERDGRAMTIMLDRPADQNRLTRDVLLTLQGLVDRLGADEEIQAVVITGSGAEFFSMGILNPAVRASYTKEQILELVRVANRLYDGIEALPRSSSRRSTAPHARARPSWRWRATSGWRQRTRRSRCPKRSGADFPAPAAPFGCRRSSAARAPWS